MHFNYGSISPANMDNPNDLKPDKDDETFKCFESVQVSIHNRSDVLDTFLALNSILNKVRSVFIHRDTTNYRYSIYIKM